MGRLRSIARARGVAGLLAVLMLNMVVLPCAMALGLEDPNCVHRPSAEQHDMAGHHGHHGHQQEANSACADVQCCDIDPASVETRSWQQKVRDGGEWDAIPLADVFMHPVCPPVRAERVPKPPDPPGAFPPRHKLFCVYLD